jgi:D-alanyl-lipoteichoic acid acyltransferase DltB (MBOAT superfamily)
MLFSSIEFIFVFLPIVLFGYHLLLARGMGRSALVWLLLCSVFFYAWWKLDYLWLLLASMAVNYSIGRYLGMHRSRGVLALGIVLNLAPLAYYKYSAFVVSNVDALLGASIPYSHKLLPLAISFFTFQQIACLVDVWRRTTPPTRDPVKYAVLVAFFPHLIAGPIVHYRELIGQFDQVLGRARAIAARYWSSGAMIFLTGLFKKVCVADYFGVHVDAFYHAVGSGVAFGWLEAWVGTLSYTLQLYFDFSGYSDMALGLALFCGIALPVNFNSPYKSRSVAEFWRRWHITLSNFLRDYIYIPLGGNRRGFHRQAANALIVMAIGGIWHGAGWTFLLWGLMHGVGIVGNHYWEAAVPRRLPAPLAWLLTMLFVHVGWVLFRSPDFAIAGQVASAMFTPSAMGLPKGIAAALAHHVPWHVTASVIFTEAVGLPMLIGALALGILAVATLPNAYQLFGTPLRLIEEHVETVAEKQADAGVPTPLRRMPAWAWGMIGGAAFYLAVSAMLHGAESPFLYFNF